MNNLKFIYDYKNIDRYRLSFNKLVNRVFGIDFEKWHQHGFWDDTYVCHSYVDQNEVVANVSASKLEMIIDGEAMKALQIGTVMTHPDYRGRGLSKSLMEMVLKKYEPEYDFIYLFANNRVLSFYPKFGFTSAGQCRYSIDITDSDIIKKKEHAAVKKLDIMNEQDRKLLREISQGRRPVSQRLGVKNGESILLWHCLNVYHENLFYLPEDKAIVIYKIEAGTLHLYDIVSPDKIEIGNILRKIGGAGVRKVIFYYTPDDNDIQLNKEHYDDSNDTLFIKPVLGNFAQEVAFPITAHT